MIELVNWKTKFAKDPFMFPSDEVDPEDKITREWHLQFMRALWSYHALGLDLHGGFAKGTRLANYREVRAYVDATHDTSKYRPQLTGIKSGGGRSPQSKKDTLMDFVNISLDNISELPRYWATVEGLFEKVEHDVLVGALDPMSDDERNMMKYRLQERQLNGDYYARMKSMGMGYEDPEADEALQALDSPDEVGLMFDTGTWKTEHEKIAEILIKFCFDNSRWHQLKREILKDDWSLGIMIARDMIDVHSKKIYSEYIDPEWAIFPQSVRSEADKITFGGHVSWMTLGEIKKHIRPGDYSEKHLKFLKEEYKDLMGNASLLKSDRNAPADHHGTSPHDSFKYPVLHGEKISYDKYVYKERTTKSGRTARSREKITYDGDDADRYAFKTRYRSSWVIGSEVVFNYGMDDFIPKKDFKECRLSYKIYKSANKGIGVQAIPIIDAQHLAWYKYQNGWAQSDPSGYAYNYAVLQGMKDTSGNKLAAIDMIRMRRQTGSMFFNFQGPMGGTKAGAGGGVAIPLKGGMTELLADFERADMVHTGKLQRVTGITESMMGSDPKPGDLVGTTEIAVIQTNNRLQPIYSAYLSVKERMAEDFLGRIQVLARTNPAELKAYFPALGRMKVDVLKIAARLSEATYALVVEPRPTEMMKRNLLTMIDLAVKSGTIEAEDAIDMQFFVEKGDLRMARSLLAFRKKQRQKMMAKMSQQQMMDNAEVQQQSLKTKGELDLQKITQQGATRDQNIRTQGDETRRTQDKINQGRKEIQEVVGDQKLEQIAKQGEEDMLQTVMAPATKETEK